MTRDELKTAKHLITQAICEHMPSAAVASGWMSEVDMTPWVRSMCQRFPFGEKRTSELGYGRLVAWLKEQGVEAGKAWVMELRRVWLFDAMRVECGGVAYGVDKPQA